jgi:MbtH protein
MFKEDEDTHTYDVIVNHEEQYSIRREGWPAAPGWREVGIRGSKAECLAYIEQVWTDMRPLSLRRQMDAFNGAPAD